MRDYENKRRFRGAKTSVLAAIAFAVIMFVSSCTGGCSRVGGSTYDNFYFAEDTIYMVLGDRKTLAVSDFMFEPSAPTSLRVTVTSSDEAVVKVDGASLTALGLGSAVVTATDREGRTADCTVVVTRDITSLRLLAPKRAMTVDEGGELEVYAVVNDGAVSASAFDLTWTIDGERAVGYSGSSYTVPAPTTAREYRISVTARASDGYTFSDETTVVFYEGFSSAPVLSLKEGSTRQVAGSETPIVPELTYTLAGGSVRPIVEWFDGDDPIDFDEASGYTPTGAGVHVLTAYVNGVRASGDIEAIVTGAIVPGVPSVDFDSFWPSVLVSYDASSESERFTIEVTKLSDGTTFEVGSAGGSELFGREKVDLATSGYLFRVKSLGDGVALTESQYSLPARARMLTEQETTYLGRSWYGANCYITSDDEFCEAYDLLLLYRPQPVNGETHSSLTMYMGYESKYTIERLSSLAFNRAGYTGIYEVDANRDGALVELNVTFKTRSEPTFSHDRVTVGQLNALTPHVSETGRTNFVPATETNAKSIDVTTTDQLYRAAELGYKPVTASGSAAARAYDYAKRLLSSIIDDDMTEEERAHAIYDWIMWRVMYDDGASSIEDVSEAVMCSAFYLESVLTDVAPYSVCDGMSKAFSLLCNMEGLPCVRVVGTASASGGTSGHAWNKVMVDGEWYVVDCTWGDSLVSVRYRTGFGSATAVRRAELASHEYFLRTDAEIAGTHFEDPDTAYPRTSLVPYGYFERGTFSVGEKSYRTYITSATDTDSLAEGVAALAASRLSSGRQTFEVFGGSVGNTSTEYFAIEIGFAENAKRKAVNDFAAEGRGMPAALSDRGLFGSVFALDDCIVVLASRSIRLV